MQTIVYSNSVHIVVIPAALGQFANSLGIVRRLQMIRFFRGLARPQCSPCGPKISKFLPFRSLSKCQ